MQNIVGMNIKSVEANSCGTYTQAETCKKHSPT